MMLLTLILLSFCLCCRSGVFGDRDAVKSVSVMEGDSVTLNPELTDIQRDREIQWRFEDIRIARVIMNITRYDDDERFRDRLKLDQTGSLTITNTTTTDSGLYQLYTIIRNEKIIKRFNVTVDEAPSPSPPPPSSVFLIELISAAAGSLLIVSVIVTFCVCRKLKDSVQSQTHEDETQADETLYKHTGQMTKSEMTEVVYTCFTTDQ